MASKSFFDDAPPVFTVRWRGYDRFQVDEHIRRIRRPAQDTLTDAEPSANEVTRPTHSAEFDVVIRSYDRQEVDDYLRRTPP